VENFKLRNKYKIKKQYWLSNYAQLKSCSFSLRLLLLYELLHHLFHTFVFSSQHFDLSILLLHDGLLIHRDILSLRRDAAEDLLEVCIGALDDLASLSLELLV
jgi:hypothetical protein